MRMLALLPLLLASELPQDGSGANEQKDSRSPLAPAELKHARDVLRHAARALKGVAEVHADFRQEQSSLLLDELLVSTGTLHLRLEPGCLVLDLTEPRRCVVRSDVRTHRVWTPEDGRAELFRFKDNRLFHALAAGFTADLVRLEEAFVIHGIEELVVVEPSEERDAPPVEFAVARLDLRPRRDRLSAVVSHLELEFDRATGVLRKVVQRNPEGESTTMRLSRVRHLAAPPPDRPPLFDRKLPPGTRVLVHQVPSQRD